MSDYITDVLSDQEKSQLLVELVGWETNEVGLVIIDGYMCREFYAWDLYSPSHMMYAWQVLNWSNEIEPWVDRGILEKWMKSNFFASPPSEIGDWLDIILEQEIERKKGMI